MFGDLSVQTGKRKHIDQENVKTLDNWMHFND